MKADEPQEPLVKFGLPISEQHKILERHASVMEERRVIADLHYYRALTLDPVLRAAFDRIGKQAPEPVPPTPIADEPVADAPGGLRRSLGLG